jgi:hypothetical protein
MIIILKRESSGEGWESLERQLEKKKEKNKGRSGRFWFFFLKKKDKGLVSCEFF